LLALMIPGLAAYGEPPERIARWFYELVGEDVRFCSALSPEWRQRVSNTLSLAKANTFGFLPATFWDSLAAIPATSAQRIPDAAEIERCDYFQKNLSSPTVKSYFRGVMVKSAMSSQVYKCMLWFPDLTGEMRNAWMSGFTRNGLVLSEAEMEGWLEEWSMRGVRPLPPTDSQHAECQKVIAFLSGTEFENVFSEEWVKREIRCSSGQACADER
jgi:hypothetical protein